jgi:hypothetical protein
MRSAFCRREDEFNKELKLEALHTCCFKSGAERDTQCRLDAFIHRHQEPAKPLMRSISMSVAKSNLSVLSLVERGVEGSLKMVFVEGWRARETLSASFRTGDPESRKNVLAQATRRFLPHLEPTFMNKALTA